MELPSIPATYLPTYGDIAAFLEEADQAFDDSQDLHEALEMDLPTATEFIRSYCYPELSYIAYLMAFQLTGSLWLGTDYETSPGFEELRKAAAHFEEIELAVSSLNEFGDEPMKRKLIPRQMIPMVDLMFELEGEIEQAGSPEDVDPSLDELHRRKTGISSLVISLLRNSGMAVAGSFPHYCMVWNYMTAANRLQDRVTTVFLA